jgi:hypothetical protein
MFSEKWRAFPECNLKAYILFSLRYNIRYIIFQYVLSGSLCKRFVPTEIYSTDESCKIRNHNYVHQ